MVKMGGIHASPSDVPSSPLTWKHLLPQFPAVSLRLISSVTAGTVCDGTFNEYRSKGSTGPFINLTSDMLQIARLDTSFLQPRYHVDVQDSV